MSVLRLAIPSPLRSLFDYLPPEHLAQDQLGQLQPGCRVLVPFGRRQVQGYLIEVAADSELPRESLRRAITILDHQALPATSLVQLCLWAVDYYQHSPGEVLSNAFPQGLREGQPHQPPGTAGWALSQRGKGLPEGALKRSPRQAQALALLQTFTALPASELKARGLSPGILRSLENRGLAERCVLQPPRETPLCQPGLALNPDQAAAFAGIADSFGRFSCHLLEGVTGSGKTEVYLQLIARCLERGDQALVLIPEIGLTPQTLARFQARFQGGIVVMHSGLSATERYRAWEAARTGSAAIVIGTRSAIFSSLQRPGLIIVDEEHDASFKQQDGFRYSARDVAVKRGQLENCTVLLGSATPALESLHNALQGKYRHHPLPLRAGSSRLPVISALDVRKQALQGGLSAALLTAIGNTLENGRQVLLFLNRRGYAPTLQCHDCGWIAQCRACDARMTVHRRSRRLRCHHCSAGERLPQRCQNCHSERLLTNGLGTEQTEEVLCRQFNRWPVHRVDSDSMQNRSAMQDLVNEVNGGEPCILLGTQMLTKGHHFPAVNLVAIIDADAMLFSADFRGEERMAQLLTQVAGRAGRGDETGTVLLQTHYPDHPIVQAMLAETYAEQARRMLSERQQTGLPPWGRLLLLRSDCADAAAGESFLSQLRRQAQATLPAGCRMIGPLPSPLQRRAGKFRSQLLVTAADSRSAQTAARMLVAVAVQLPVRGGVNWSIDVDPLDLG
ncbi:primosomal protein N' [Kineobactrum sediminis]|uniref:Replication restart protein PriA n=1 Tax=Kineobactrum sediminis TaxID=1905677 RepID=A0A2N5Y779_9GAMM|nr:primosomal protein N' [Kineobactrum sediminis]PLW84239.1 primosomal protein N' [Kineobactrum sediminis]